MVILDEGLSEIVGKGERMHLLWFDGGVFRQVLHYFVSGSVPTLRNFPFDQLVWTLQAARLAV